MITQPPACKPNDLWQFCLPMPPKGKRHQQAAKALDGVAKPYALDYNLAPKLVYVQVCLHLYKCHSCCEKKNGYCEEGAATMGEESQKVANSYQTLLSTGLTTCKSVFNEYLEVLKSGFITLYLKLIKQD